MNPGAKSSAEFHWPQPQNEREAAHQSRAARGREIQNVQNLVSTAPAKFNLA